MILKRIFHPVGHGAFYVERFIGEQNESIFTIVYDCGRYEGGKPGCMSSIGYKRWIEGYIKNCSELAIGERIDILFISHFHADHINGIDYILQNFDVRKIVLPVITPLVVLDALSLIKDKLLINDLLLLINNLVRGEYSDKVCSLDIPIDLLDEQTNNVDCLCEDFNTIKSINRPTRLSFNRWYYKPFYSVDIQKKTQLNKAFQTAFPHIFENNELSLEKLLDEISKSGVVAFKKEYTNVFGRKHNSYSMTLFSGLLCDKICHKNCHIKTVNINGNLGQMDNSQLCRVNCLYMGDYIALGKGLNNVKLFYIAEWKNIGILQVPHHGSKKNSNDDLFKDRERLCMISADSNDKNNHPDQEVLDAITRNNSVPILVTELPKSKQEFTINIS